MFKKAVFGKITHFWGDTFYILINLRSMEYVIETPLSGPNFNKVKHIEKHNPQKIEEVSKKDIVKAIEEVRRLQNLSLAKNENIFL